MNFYKDTPQRKLAQAAPKVTPRVPLQGWCRLDPKREAPLPIDDSDGGCETNDKTGRAWSRQIDTLKIEPGDAITDSAEAYYLMQQHGIDNVIVMGVHTNMCVLGRPFSIRQMVAQGKNVVLVRDLTDTMYNPARAPFVSHFTGTDLVVEHIEKYWCPSVTSADFLGGKEFRFAGDRRPHLVMVAADDEYRTERVLPEFALKHLGKNFRVSFVYADAQDRYRLPGLEVLNEADLALFSVRRRPLPREQLEVVRKFVAQGKPVVGLRTTSHGFAPRSGENLPQGVAAWPDFDRAVLGCTYQGHHPNNWKTTVQAAADMTQNPILKGVKVEGFPSAGSLYLSLPLAREVHPLLLGRAGNAKPEPVAWTRVRNDGGRVFYTSLGHTADFREPSFVMLLRNGIFWAAGMPIPGSEGPEKPKESPPPKQTPDVE
jgi:type 1 glutamine amidotransferase